MLNRLHVFTRAVLALTLLLLLVAGTIPVVRAQSATTEPPLQIDVRDGATYIRWTAPTTTVDANSLAALGPLTHHDGYELPIELVSLILAPAASVDVQILQLITAPLQGTLQASPSMLPPALDWKPDPNMLPVDSYELPKAPIFLVRDGIKDGRRQAVFAISPVFQDGSGIRVVSQLGAAIPGAFPLHEGGVYAGSVAQANTAPQAAVAVPINGDALKQAVKLIVTEPGIHEVLYSALDAGTVDNSKLRLTYGGSEVAVETLDDRLRFYAGPAGDRWNQSAVYWLTFDASGPKRMGTVASSAASPAGKAYEHGQWTDDKFYDSVYAGADGDHWFNADMRVDSSTPAGEIPAITLSPTMKLPAAGGQTTFTAAVTAFVRPPTSSCLSDLKEYKLQFVMGGDTQTAAWNPAPGCAMQYDWEQSVATSGQPSSITLKLLPGSVETGIKLDSVSWVRPVTLNFGGQAADFWTDAGAWSYTLSGLPGSWQLYDVTDPANPMLVVKSGNSFAQADDGKAHHYYLANLTQPLAPTVGAHTAVQLGDVKAANAIYIGPGAFANAVQPLLDLRRAQGYATLFVDVQKIFDKYGFGQVSPTAIRNFLRNETDWQNTNRQISVVLVGDGTYDPFDILKKHTAGDIYPVPPFMEDVDPYIRETACESCYAQLNGDDAKWGDDPDNPNKTGTPRWFVADVWIGRLPARNAAELKDMVDKLVAYEAEGSDLDPWRARFVFLADNYIKQIDGQNHALRDDAGDFPEFSDGIIEEVPSGTRVERIYYDPAPDRVIAVDEDGKPIPVPNKSGYYFTEARTKPEPWRNADNARANQAAIASLSGGAGLVIYNGHSNHFQYARTNETETDPKRPTWLLYTNDVYPMNNTDKPFVMLSMTCYTSLFAMPTANGTLDELLIRRTGAGAVAVWGPAGLTVAHGHDLLQQGFMQKLWSSPSMSLRMGDLLEAGYEELRGGSVLNQDALLTFLLMGDPLTKARINTQIVFLPTINK